MLRIDKTYRGWSLERFSRHVFYWLAWVLFYAIVNSSYRDGSILVFAGKELLFMGVKVPFTYFVIYYLVPNYLLSKQYAYFFTGIFWGAITGGIAMWVLDFYWFYPHIFGHHPDSFWNIKMAYKVVDLIYIASLPTVLKMQQRQVLQEKQTRLLVEQKMGAELKFLRNQLHPHFLFNTLNNLYSMVLTNHPKASDVVVRLSDLMSYMLYDCEKKLVSLEKEISHLKNYIELEKIRYGKRLDISFETGGDIEGGGIAPLLLLPFLENAFKHGVEKNESISWIRINLWVKEDELIYMIENMVSEVETDENMPRLLSGIGLTNVRKRLELLYPGQHSLEITSGDTFLVSLKLKLSYEMPHS